MDFDYCPQCGMPTFRNDEVVLISNEFYHRYCIEGSTFVARQEQLRNIPSVVKPA